MGSLVSSKDFMHVYRLSCMGHISCDYGTSWDPHLRIISMEDAVCTSPFYSLSLDVWFGNLLLVLCFSLVTLKAKLALRCFFSSVRNIWLQ